MRKWFELRTVTAPTPWSPASSTASSMAARADTKPRPLSASSTAAAPRPPTTSSLGAGLSSPRAIPRRYRGAKLAPWLSMPDRSARTRISAIPATCPSGTPAWAKRSARRASNSRASTIPTDGPALSLAITASAPLRVDAVEHHQRAPSVGVDLDDGRSGVGNPQPEVPAHRQPDHVAEQRLQHPAVGDGGEGGAEVAADEVEERPPHPAPHGLHALAAGEHQAGRVVELLGREPVVERHLQPGDEPGMAGVDAGQRLPFELAEEDLPQLRYHDRRHAGPRRHRGGRLDGPVQVGAVDGFEADRRQHRRQPLGLPAAEGGE